ncbi:MAG: cupin domain-containing protein [Acidimicrobiia bacterium]|nr:cupin domain-containing protein [Acidimicrobiia bacterium]
MTAPAPHVFRKEGTADSVTAVDANVAAASETVPDRYDFVLTRDDTQGRYSLVDMVLSPTFDSSPGHSHREHSETFYMISGEMEWTVDGESQILGPGDLVFIPPFAHHIARAVGGEAPRALLIWEPAGWEVGMAESAKLTAEQRANEEFMAEFRVRNDTYL